ncbi:MAG: bifunctional adenosylcobinamide kinase/adenosylcobinamide-phosphate guanylyltransferase [Pseudomonadota bacterium]
MAHLTLVLGGARSGKSARALALAEAAAAPAARVFVATAEALDDEMADRIARHKAERGAGWALVECPLDLPDAVSAQSAAGRVLLIDCLTLWLSNLMHHERAPEAAAASLLAAIADAPGGVIAVSNEVGMGLAPTNALGRAFRDAQGRLNQQVAAAADRVEFVAAGLPLALKG